MDSSLQTQYLITQQSKAMQNAIADLHKWEKEIKEKEKRLIQTSNDSEVSFFQVKISLGISLFELKVLCVILFVSATKAIIRFVDKSIYR